MSLGNTTKALVPVSALFLMLSATPASAEIGNGEYAVGFHSGFSSAGIAARIGIDDDWDAEGVLGIFGTLNYYGARGLYTLQDDDEWYTYAFGTVGIWTWESVLIDESVFGFGGGAGVEWDWRSLNSDLPPVTWYGELGLAVASFDSYSFSSFSIGTGFRWHFE